MTDAPAWRPGSGADWRGPSSAAAPSGASPFDPAGGNGSYRLPAPGGSGSPWWSDALRDPWRDPASPSAVIIKPSGPPPGVAEPEPVAPAPGSRRGLGLIFLVAVVSALLAGALGGTLGYVFAARGGAGRAALGGTGSSAAPLTQRAPTSLAGVVQKVLPSVVTVKIGTASGYSLGSGFVVSTDGYIVTNDHVVEGLTGAATVTFSDSTNVTAKLIGVDEESDVAVLKVTRADLKPVTFGDSDQVAPGDPVLAFGAPLALSNTVTYGIVSALDRTIEADEPGGPTRYYAAIQTDAAVNHGNSGGPLVDGAGRVVGINSVIKSVASDSDEAGNIGLAFAIPINQAKRIAQDIIETGHARRTVIGAELKDTYTNPNGGVQLASVQQGGPAANAGLKPGDVLTKINGVPLEDPTDLIALVRKYAPGQAVSVDFRRAGSTESAQVTLAADAK